MISTADLKTYLNITASNLDSYLANVILYSTSIIENYCNRPIKAVNKIMTFIGNNNNVFLLPYLQINSITSLEISEKTANSYTTISNTKYFVTLIDNIYHLYLQDSFTDGYYYRLTANVGYSTIPYDIQQVCFEMCKVIFDNSNQGQGTLSFSTINENLQGTAFNKSIKDLSENHKSILNKYRLVTI